MNPDTNKFEELIEDTDQVKAIQRQIDRLSGELYRPNGEKVPKHWTILTVGEKIVVKDYTFKVAHIGEGYLVLEPIGPIIIGEEKESI